MPLLACVLVATSIGAASPAPRWVVGLEVADARSPQHEATVRNALASSRARVISRLPFAVVVEVPDGQRALEQLRRSPGVRWLESERRIRVSRRVAPNDTCFAEQWTLASGTTVSEDASVDILAAWELSRGESGSGQRTRIAVIDDGFELTHPELVGQFVAESFDCSGDVPDDDASALGTDAHGTQTAGVIAAVAEDARGVAGVCPRCEVLAIRLLGAGGPDELYTTGSAAAAALVWAIDHGADVVNNSWGPADGNPLDPMAEREVFTLPRVVEEAIDYALREGRGGLGALVVWSAGNGNELIAYDGFASAPGVLTVGAVDASAQLAYYSDFGRGLDLVAPSSGGVGLPAVWTTDLTGPNGEARRDDAACLAAGSPPCEPACLDDLTNRFGGTSAAAALVSGVAGLVLAHAPELNVAQLTEVLTTTAVAVDTARGQYVDGWSELYGAGRIAPRAALEASDDYTSSCTHGLELCGNGLDDDCDGEVDEEPRCAPCTPDRGRELCDGRDNNCDGRIDEGYVCVTTDRPSCAPCTRSEQCEANARCRSTSAFGGTWCFARCDEGEACPLGYACDGEVCALAPSGRVRTCLDVLRGDERCDGIDNDDDALIDDVDEAGPESVAAAAACGVLGVCAGGVRAACVSGAWRCDYPATYESIERSCDGLDNDCDGVVDEAMACHVEPSARAVTGCAAALGVAWWALVLAAFTLSRRARGSRR